MRAVFAAPYESAPGTTRNLPGWLANGSYYQKKLILATFSTACSLPRRRGRSEGLLRVQAAMGAF